MKKITISIIMGSDSDLPIMKDAIDIMEEFKIPYEVLVLSAHRTPDETAEFANKALDRGIKVIIAGAGGAAHLAGVVASFFPLPVIGIPIKTVTLSGLDSLYSIVQMPPGVPVATVGINAAKNAGLLAIEILATGDINLQRKLNIYKYKQKNKVVEKTNKLKKIGYQQYLKIMKEK